MRRIKVGTLFLIIIFTMLTCSCNNKESKMYYNNDVYYSDLISITYSYDEFVEFGKTMTYNNVYFDDFKDLYKAECIRETFQGYYVVIELDNNRIGFAFFDDSNQLVNTLTASSFKNSNEFNFIKNNVTAKNQINDFDQNYFTMPISSVDIDCHITSDGMIVIKYSRQMNLYEGSQYNPTVESIEFYNNEEIILNSDNYFINNTPYILSMDKNTRTIQFMK